MSQSEYLYFSVAENDVDKTHFFDEVTGAKIQPEVSRIITKEELLIATQQARDEVERLFNQTEKQLQLTASENSISAAELSWAQYTKGDRYSKYLSFSALLSIRTTQKVVKCYFTRVCTLSLILNNKSIESTVTKNYYRTFSGICNNVNNPQYGAIHEPLQRLLSPDYEDMISQPRVSSNKSSLPSAGKVAALFIFRPSPQGHMSCSLMLAQWASFIYDDIAHVASTHIINDGFFSGSKSLLLPCCNTLVNHPECFSITDAEGRCITYSRSLPAPRKNCTLGHREQGNMVVINITCELNCNIQVTSYLDASQLYGTSTEVADKLRLFEDGYIKLIYKSCLSLLNLRTLSASHGGLPQGNHEEECISQSTNSRECLLAGSNRINFSPMNAAMYTIWMRQHNLIAGKLKKVNPMWSDEQLFQESRRIVIAQIQHITYNEFVPVIIGKENLKRYAVDLQLNGYDSRYGIVINDPSFIFQRNRLDAVIRFLVKSPIMKPGLHITPELKGAFKRANSFDKGIDIAAHLIQMGRDHGIPSYLQWRRYCNLEDVQSFTSMSSKVHFNMWKESQMVVLQLLPSVNISLLEQLYDSPEDIDLIVGGLAEIPLPGALLGPTFSCLFAKQLQKTKRGDRFWYENFFHPTAFSASQLDEIRKTTLARIICDNADDIRFIQHNVFALEDEYGNCPVSCSDSFIDSIDLSPWKDEEPKKNSPITKATIEKAIRLGVQQYNRLLEAEGKQIRAQGPAVNNDRHSAVFSHASLMAPKKESLNIAKTAGVLREATNVLIRGTGLEEEERLPLGLDPASFQKILPDVDVEKIIENYAPFLGKAPCSSQKSAELRNKLLSKYYLSGHDPLPKEQCLPQPLPCDHTTKYRSYSGWCNNLRFPKYGNAFGPLRRLLNPAYDDGFDTPRSKAKSGGELPSARAVSNAVHADAQIFHVKFTHMLMQFGQILDHDMMHSPIARGPNNTILNCSSCDSQETLSIHCFPIKIGPGDPFFPAKDHNGKPKCIPFARSLLGQLTLGYRNQQFQLNQLTAFLDASSVYGSTECEANRLRLFRLGKLNYTDLSYKKEVLPQGNQERDCRSILSSIRKRCFVAGDERNNEQPGLTVTHTILLREHNRIAEELHRINNFWTDEQLYQTEAHLVPIFASETSALQERKDESLCFIQRVAKAVGLSGSHIT
ncbi:animal hem peroxidase [Dictyocaulus viviparus]|uniref:Animal hem peroxidase n=1 Tax=Dictyocaulus viviparus TaxID=29172 RepID=A0A0D8XWV9_DICVI|nr:animal hem peroxidase [Dictyocaulus viviparus]